MDHNNVSIVGRLARDPEIRMTAGGKAVANFGLAVNPGGKDAQGADLPAHFFDVTAWEKTAEAVKKYCSKGDQVLVAGRLKQECWTDRENGGKRSRVIISASQVQFLRKKGDRAQGGGQGPGAQGGGQFTGAQAPSAPPAQAESFDDLPDIDPFGDPAPFQAPGEGDAIPF